MPDPWNVHTVVFDLDDTLYPEREYVYSGFAAVGAHLQSELKVVGFEDAARKAFDRGMRGRVFDEVLPAVGASATPQIIATLVDVYRQHTPTLHLYPDAADALQWLRSRCRLGLITDGYACSQEQKVNALGLPSVIPHRILTDSLGRSAWKPSPVAFRRMMQLCPGPAAGFVYVGDNPSKDFLPGRELGWRTIRVLRQGSEHSDAAGTLGAGADIEIDSLLQLREVLAPSSSAST